MKFSGPTIRPIVIRKPYDSGPPATQQHYPQQQPIRIPVSTQQQQPFRPLNQNLPADDAYADQALRQAREHRSASHAINMLPSPLTPERSFDDKDRMFERSATARQVIRCS